jgi:hypothetical protein
MAFFDEVDNRHIAALRAVLEIARTNPDGSPDVQIRALPSSSEGHTASITVPCFLLSKVLDEAGFGRKL